MPSSRKRPINADPIEEGIDYARQVVARKIASGKFVRLAAERFLEDLKRAKAGEGPWVFDSDRALAPIEICQQLPNIKGPLADRPIELMAWQLCWTANLFGFIERETGWRRFRQASIWVPRGNGKSTWLAPLALYCAFCEGEGGAEAYAAAVTRDQSKIVWSTAWEMLRRAAELRHYLGVEQSAHSIFQPRTASNFLPLSSDAKSLDGLNVHFACLDEIASHRTARVYDIILTALGKRLQPLLMSISTATANTTGIGKQVWDLTVKILTGVLEDERFFGVIYAADEGEDPFAEATLAKANPSWGRTVVPEQVRMIARQAKNQPAQEAVYKTRHLNIWVTGNRALFAMDHWRACKVEGLRLEDFTGRPCILGLDIANKIDLTALVLLFAEEDDGGKEVYSVFCRAWLPDARVESQPAYARWIADGWLTQTAGETTDFSMIEEAILECCASFEVQAVTYDPWSATQLAQRMMERNVPMVEYPMTVSTMSEPTKAVDVTMREHRFRHDGNPVLAWCLSNVVGHRDAKDNIFPRKELPEHKIDGAIALIMALGQQTVRSAQESLPTIYQGDRTLLFW
jgi:phage terminase large subunit-like protein